MVFHCLLQRCYDEYLLWFFLHFLLKFKPFDEFFPFQNMIASLSGCVATVCVCVCVCVCVHPLNKDVSQAIIGTILQCVLQKMVGWVALRFVIALCWSLNRLNVTANVSFYLIAILALHVKCHSLKERNVLGNMLIVDHHVKKKIYVYIFTRTVRKALNAISDNIS